MQRKAKCAVVFLLVALLATDQTLGLQKKKKKRGIYHGLHGLHGLQGYALPAAGGLLPHADHLHFLKGYHPSPYAKFSPGPHKSFGGVLPPGYALFPGSASVASYQRNFPRYPTVYGGNPFLGFGVAPVKPLTGFASVATGLTPLAPAPVLPAPVPPPVPAAYPQAFYPLATTGATAGSTQQTFFATYPQKPLIPVAVPVAHDPAKIPQVVVSKPVFASFSAGIPTNGLIPVPGSYYPGVAVPNGQPQFVGVPVVTGSASGATPSYATTLGTGTTTVTQAPQQPWRPVVVNHPAPTPAPPANAYLPPYGPSSQGQIYISSTPAPALHDHHPQQPHHQSLLDYDQETLHHPDGSGAFNGQPYDVASNHDCLGQRKQISRSNVSLMMSHYNQP
ncbi:BCL-6 corepressor-like protein 1 [Anopheles bellator]|uniref:BCL-6 corepressor-like protein 1 n=1 Tax=Anopheles bellator TaxID=139047 RepID=UPI002647398B|nr:BCL-6 corepressor-like protein 1 [Anopheles bellator]